jgi:hypothetical protein
MTGISRKVSYIGAILKSSVMVFFLLRDYVKIHEGVHIQAGKDMSAKLIIWNGTPIGRPVSLPGNHRRKSIILQAKQLSSYCPTIHIPRQVPFMNGF